MNEKKKFKTEVIRVVPEALANLQKQHKHEEKFTKSLNHNESYKINFNYVDEKKGDKLTLSNVEDNNLNLKTSKIIYASPVKSDSFVKFKESQNLMKEKLVKSPNLASNFDSPKNVKERGTIFANEMKIQIKECETYDGRKLSKTQSSGASTVKNKFSSFKDFGLVRETNKIYREQMEDMCEVYPEFLGDSTKSLFTLFDGHGGEDISKYALERFPEVFKETILLNKCEDENSIEQAFLKLDEEIGALANSQDVGSTAVVCYLKVIKDERWLYSANVGDSRAVLVSKNSAKRLTYDHKSIDKEEEARVKKAGGLIFKSRVFGTLAITRALGDFSLKGHGVIANPNLIKTKITENDLFVVIASDGVWDVIDEENLYKIVLDNASMSTQNLTELIVKKSVDLGSRDNISCIIVKLN